MIYYSDSIGSTPAIVDRQTGDIFLNSNVWDTLPKPYQVFILEHEKGHYKRQTTNELEADHYAFTQIAGTFPESLKNTVRVLYDVLPYTSPMHGLRLLNMYRIALCFDYEKEPTAERLQEIRAVENEILKDFANNSEFMDYIFSQQKSDAMANYEFPGYSPEKFEPSVGRWFRDFPINQCDVPWPTGNTTQDNGQQQPGTVSLDYVPDFTTVEIDWKSVAIGILLVLAIIGLTKI